MNLLHALHQLLGTQPPHSNHPLNGRGLDLSGHGLSLQSGPGIQQGPGAPQQSPGAYEDGSGVNMGRMPMPNIQQHAMQLPNMGGYSQQNPQQMGYLDNLPQGGQFNPGFTPLQNNRPIRYNQAPQHPFGIY